MLNPQRKSDLLVQKLLTAALDKHLYITFGARQSTEGPQRATKPGSRVTALKAQTPPCAGTGTPAGAQGHLWSTGTEKPFPLADSYRTKAASPTEKSCTLKNTFST